MALLDVNALVALVWDSHVHHAPMRAWFSKNRSEGWSTCAVTESGFVRTRLVTFDAVIVALADGQGVELLSI